MYYAVPFRERYYVKINKFSRRRAFRQEKNFDKALQKFY